MLRDASWDFNKEKLTQLSSLTKSWKEFRSSLELIYSQISLTPSQYLKSGDEALWRMPSYLLSSPFESELRI